MDEAHFFGPKLVPKAPKLPKIHISGTVSRRKLVDPSKWPQDLLYCGYTRIYIYSPPTTESALKIQFSVFWGLTMKKLLDFLNLRLYKFGWPLKMTARMDLPYMHTSQTTENATMKILLIKREFISI